MDRRILVIQNAPWEGPGLVGDYAKAAGIPLTTVELFRSKRDGLIPIDGVDGGEFSAVVGLGSPSTAYLPETNPHHEETVELFKAVRKTKTPSFNICYSMQLFAVAHGGRVTKNPNGKEVGFEGLSLRPEGRSDPVVGPLGDYRTLQWHGDVVEVLPRGAVSLASSTKTKNQVAVLDGIHYLIQADGQAATPKMVRSWLEHDSKWATEGTGVDPEALVREAVERGAYYRNTFLRMFGNFLSIPVQP